MAKSKFLSEFRTFVERGSAIDMAVGIIVGSVMTSLVNSLVADIIMPPIGLLLGNIDFSQFFVVLAGGDAGAHYNTVAEAQAAGATTMNIGVFLNSVVSFFVTMFAIFVMIRVMNKVRTKTYTRFCPYCRSSISAQASKCPNCCSKIEPIKGDPNNESELEKDIKNIAKQAGEHLKKFSKIANNSVKTTRSRARK